MGHRNFPSHLLIVGGQNRRDASLRPEWEGSEYAVMAVLDVAAGRLGRILRYQSPLDWLPDDEFASHIFKSSSLYGSRLYLATTTSVLVLDLPSLEPVARLSLPAFNDVHHVIRRANGNLAVANTGLDQVIEMTESGDVVGYHGTNDHDPWATFDPGTDYRRVASTKPHVGHPNFLTEIDGELWVTRFKQCDMARLTDLEDTIPVSGEAPHDGLLHEGRLYFTSVDGQVTVVDAGTRTRVAVTRIRRADKQMLGWCRGIQPVGSGHAVVAFSRIRRTRFKANVKWVSETVRRASQKEHLPTRVVLADLDSGDISARVSTEPVGLDTIFSVLPLPSELGADLLLHTSDTAQVTRLY